MGQAELQIVVNRQRCVSSGQCTHLAPEVFDQDDDGVVVSRLDTIPDQTPDAAAARAAARDCPVGAIAVVEVAGA